MHRNQHDSRWKFKDIKEKWCNNREWKGIQRKEYKIKDINVNINTVYFHVTQRCNLNCTYCYNKKNLNLSKELDTKNIIKILNKLKKINVEVVNFTGENRY